jgi:AraC family transcriptional regulator of adaptative response / DNA-3-methyladenine glycosylase II
MEMDPERCRRAVLARDRRFDGRFFAAVVTTGIYCRPICPVAPAKAENTRYYACAAAAEAAGFRPCMRCRPETAPGTPAWLGTSATVSRALRLINDGALDGGDVDALAARLGVGARHLRRLFTVHLGASPLAVARTRRVHFARRLLDETKLPMTALATSAGFGSVRQFNQAMRDSFRRSPTALRRAARGQAVVPVGPELRVRLPYRPPFDWAGLLAFFRDRATPGVEIVDGDAYRRTIEVDGVAGTIEVRPGAGEAQLALRVRLPETPRLLHVVERVRRIFDLGADPLRIASHLRRDPRLGPAVARRPGLRVPGAWDGFELAVRAILGQQVTVRGATTLAGRLARAFGAPLPGGPADGLERLFPKPAVLADADLSAVGLPTARAATIRYLARAVARGDLALDAAAGLDDFVARLTRIPGIGPWSAHYIALRALGETDAFPSSDLGLRRALTNGAGVAPSAAEIERLAEAWRPWRGYGAIYLWTEAADERPVVHPPGQPPRTAPAGRQRGRPRAHQLPERQQDARARAGLAARS